MIAEMLLESGGQDQNYRKYWNGSKNVHSGGTDQLAKMTMGIAVKTVCAKTGQSHGSPYAEM